MTSGDGPKDLVHKEERHPASLESGDIILGDSNVLKTSGLTEEQIQDLRMQHAKGMIDLHRKAQELQVDIHALDSALSEMSKHTAEVSKAGDSVTMTHSQTNTMGRTEVIMGNTEKAAEGKLTKTQTGEDDNTLKYVIIAAIVIIVVAMAAFGG